MEKVIDVFYKLGPVIAVLALISNVLRPFITVEEQLFMGSISRFNRKLFIWTFFGLMSIIYCLSFTGYEKTNNGTYLPQTITFYLNEKITVFIFFVFLIYLLGLLLVPYFHSKIHKLIINRPISKFRVLLVLIFVFVIPAFIFVFINLYIGFVMNVILQEANEIYTLNAQHSSLVMLSLFTLSPMYPIAIGITLLGVIINILFLRKYKNLLDKTIIKVDIILKDESILRDKIIINHNMSGYMLIADSDNTNKLAIPKEGIYLIKFKASTKLFNRPKKVNDIKIPFELNSDDYREILEQTTKKNYV